MGLFCSGSRVENWDFIVPRYTKSTHNSAIYKLTNEPVGCLGQHCSSIVPCPLNSVRRPAIYRLTDGLESWRIKLLKDVKSLILKRIKERKDFFF
jgi:hypothetical protein